MKNSECRKGREIMLQKYKVTYIEEYTTEVEARTLDEAECLAREMAILKCELVSTVENIEICNVSLAEGKKA